MKKFKLFTVSTILFTSFILAACGGGGNPSSEAGGSSQGGGGGGSNPPSQQSSQGGGGGGDISHDTSLNPDGTVNVYLVIKDGKYDGKAGESFAEVFVENAFKLVAHPGDALPGADKVTSNQGATFLGWMTYEGGGAPTKYTEVPSYNNVILYANFELGTGGSGGGGGGGSSEGGDPSKPTTGMAVVVNGTTYLSLTNEGAWDMDPSYTQYSYKAGATLKAGDILSFYDADNDASWNSMRIDTANTAELSSTSTGIKVGKAGTYDIYIKMKMGDDNIYVGDHK